MKWLSSAEIRKELNLTPQALYALRKSGKLEYKEIAKGFYRYLLPEDFREIKNKNIAVYARVSTSKQKKDLENQLSLLKQFVNANGYIIKEDYVFSDIASGMDENRRSLNRLLSCIKEEEISKLYITNKERLTRFGFGYFKEFCSLYNVEIIEINETEDKSFETESVEDLIAIIHHFSMKFYGKRKKLLNSLKETLQYEDK